MAGGVGHRAGVAWSVGFTRGDPGLLQFEGFKVKNELCFQPNHKLPSFVRNGILGGKKTTQLNDSRWFGCCGMLCGVVRGVVGMRAM